MRLRSDRALVAAGVVCELLVLAAAVGAGSSPRCDGCGMFLAGHERTVHRMGLAAGGHRAFCGFACLADALGRIPPDQVAAIEATDFATGAFVDARAAIYVVDSDAPTVMNAPSLVAFGSASAAAAYRSAHGGRFAGFRERLEAARTQAGSPAAAAADHVAHAPAYVLLPRPGARTPLDAVRSFTFSFDKRPAMETIMVKVEVFAGGKKDTSLEVKGNADMPLMHCQAGRPDRSFALNKKGDFLLPFTFGMPGAWELYLTFFRDGQVVFRGKYAFEI